MKILVVEDDELNAYALTAVLTNQNYVVEVATDGDAAWDLIQTYDYDLILLDVMLPKRDGISLCRQIRSNGRQMPILLLTGCDSSHEKAIGLDAGADDYVVKPFDEEELVARVRALLRRGGTISQPILECGNLQLDPSSCEVTYGEQLLSLTPKEYALLELFLRNRRRVFSCSMILEHLWSYEDTPGEEAVRTHIKGLRMKLRNVGAASDLIETVYGIGYRLKPQEEESKGAGKKEKSQSGGKSQSDTTLTAIAGIWRKFYGRVDQQVRVIEQAALAITQGALNLELHLQARQEAHTLAGSLGTFGLPEGSKLARKIEQLLKSEPNWTPKEITKVQNWVQALRQEVAGQQPGAESSPSVNHSLPLVLVVDRDAVLAEQLTQASTGGEWQVTTTTNLKQARNILYQEHPSLVLLNPGVSAHQEDSLNFLAELAQCKPPVPVIVFTEQTDFQHRLQLARQGEHTFLQKPQPASEVMGAIAQILQQVPNAEAKVLAVDDDPKILALLQTLLHPWGLKVITLDDPRRFWETLKAETPDLLILDVEMPHTNGIELCQVVRNDAQWSELPILFLTVHSDAEIVNQVYSVGADDFVSKPIIGPELVTRIINRLERVKLLRRVSQKEVGGKQGCRGAEEQGSRGEQEKSFTQSPVPSPQSPLPNPHYPLPTPFFTNGRAIFDAEPECVKIVAADGTILEINPAGLAILEADHPGAVVGQSVYNFIAPEYQQAFRQLNASVCQGQKGSLEFEIITCQGHRRWMATHAVPLHNTANGSLVQLAITRDTTDYKQVEAEIQRVNRTLQTLSNCNQVLCRAQDENDLLHQVCEIIVKVGGYRLAWVAYAEHDTLKNIRPVAQAGYEDGYLQSLHLTWADTIRGQGPTGSAIRTGKTTIIQNILTDSRYEIWRCQAISRGYAASIALPLLANGQAFGALNLYAAEPDAFDVNEVKLLEELTADLAYGILALRNQRDRQRAETALRESEESLALVLEAVNLGIWDWDLTTNHITWSDSHARLFGLEPGNFNDSYKTFQACVFPEDWPGLEQAFHTAQQHKTDFNHEFRVVWPDGSIHWVEGTGKLYYNPSGVAVRMLGTAKDISNRKQIAAALQTANNELELRVAERTAELVNVNRQLHSELEERQRVEAELRISQVRLARILDIADDAIISIDGSQKITIFNQGAEKIFGYSAQEIIGQSLNVLLPQRFAEAHRQHVTGFRQSPSMARRMGERREIYGCRKDGTEFPAEASISKLHINNEVIYTVILRDVTEQKQIGRMKDEFVSVVSHELRTPLTSIHGSLGMLTSGLLSADSEQGKRLLQIATDSTERLVRLINDILDIERIESGKVKMERETCNLTELIESAVSIMQPLANKAQVKLSISSPPVQLWVDPDRIVQTLTNLLSNAIKFSTPEKTVWLVGQQYGDEILLTVKDTGRGIPTDKLQTIFERFQQVDSSDSRNHDGTGLGLAICQSIVQQHGGRIWVESVLGEGSTFYFTLPILPVSPSLELVDSSPIAHSPLPTPHSPLVLVCDDDPVIRIELQTLLERGGYRVITVASGEDAIALASHQHPDVILLDLLMPGMNGWETMALLKERAETQDIPIVICSVYKQSSSSQKSADFVDWVSKPVQESYLLHSLRTVIAKSSQRARILIVEDDADLADLLSTLFERHDIETFQARTGREAIRLSQEVNPDLLILDLILPEIDGFTVVDWLQQHNRLCNIPLVVYSAQDLDESERKRLKLGNTEFLTKGRITTQEFEQRVIELLQRITHNIQEASSYEHQANSSG
ncbi:PAS domain S-box [Nostoc sp. PCC 7524]|uniref:response regulator n=1 Tax=Nostoc sp. (strain ATCC 29411 / PCC 7524) TaxID=28072 RepID=UPI00029F2D46|nr:response regulator [Nostoc sp. PCC 7524]AFY47596.1 PAS domain S-box [Nostoc sp. PCC 7524]